MLSRTRREQNNKRNQVKRFKDRPSNFEMLEKRLLLASDLPMVGIDDYALWKETFGSTTELVADGNGNGVIDTGDYTIYRDNLGQSNGMTVATSRSVIAPTKAVAWGGNDDGQTDVPVDLTDATAIAAGIFHNLALRNDGSVVAWGYNSDGQTDVPHDCVA